MKIMFEMIINFSLALLVSVALISMMALIKNRCEIYIRNKWVGE